MGKLPPWDSNMTIDKVIDGVINVLSKAGASKWSVKDKGALIAAVKLALLPERERQKDRE